MTVHVSGHFNPEALYIALDRERRARRISWREISRQTGVRTVGLGTTLGRGHNISAEYLCRLMLWLGTSDITPFVHRETS